MLTRHHTLLSILLILSLSSLAGFEVFILIESLYHYRSPLKDTPPAAGELIGTALTDKVIIVLMDALREDTSLEPNLMPTLNQLRKQGASASMSSRPPSYSAPGYATILTGAWPDINDGPVFNLEYGEIPAITQNTIFSITKQSGLKTAISGFYWFEKLIRPDDIDLSFYSPGEDRAADRQVVDEAFPWVSDKSINLVLIHIDQIDYAGHYEGGPIDPAWDDAAHRADHLLAEIILVVDPSTTTMLVFSDHGQIDQGGHGGHDAITLREPFVAFGKGINPGNYGPIRMVDIAPTIAVLLGNKLPSSSVGRPLVEMLTLTELQKQDIAHKHTLQQQLLIKVYGKIMQNGGEIPGEYSSTDSETAITLIQKKSMQNGRLVRSLSIAMILGSTIYIGIRKYSTSLLWMLVGAVLYAAIFHLKLSVLDGSIYSFSIINDPLLYIQGVLLDVLLAFMIAVAIYGLVVITPQKPIAQATTQSFRLFGLTAVTMLLTLLPALYYIIVNGFVIGRVLPDFGLLYFCMLSLVQVIIIGISGLTLTGLFAGLSTILHYRRK